MESNNEEEQVEYYFKRSPWTIVFWVVACFVVVGIAAIIFVPGLLDRGTAEEREQAKSAIRSVVRAAESYRTDNANVYEGITAAKIKDFTGGVKVVEGTPKAGQVGITDYNSDRLVLAYKGKSGKEYIATVKAGEIEFNF